MEGVEKVAGGMRSEPPLIATREALDGKRP